MFILDRISLLLKENGKTQKELCEYLDLKQQAFTNWKNGNNDSYRKHLPEIALFLNTTVDYLLGNANIKEKPFTDTDEELDNNEIVIRGRDGRYVRKRLSDSQLKALQLMIEELPDVPDNI